MDDITLAPLPPFAGRQATLTRLLHYLRETAPHALCFTSLEGMGKTALLHQIPKLDSDFIGIYVVANEPRLVDEGVWLTTLIKRTLEELEHLDFNVTRLSDMPLDVDMRVWMNDIFLPEVTRLIRPQRRLVWMLDDVHLVLDAMQKKNLPNDLPQFLHQLLQTHKQLTIVSTADIAQEAQLSGLSPLIHADYIERINRLSADESHDLLRQTMPTIDRKTSQHIFEQSGGIPRLLQAYAQALQDNLDVEHATQRVYDHNKDTFKKSWQILSRDERIVLTAMSNLSYENPLRAITPPLIETWLVETDYPMDIITIHAQLRSLDYQELVVSTPSKIELVSQLFQRWLFENARIDDPIHTPTRQRTTVFVGVALLIALIVVLFALNILPSPLATNPTPIATATLEN
jgi:hypothetical protein